MFGKTNIKLLKKSGYVTDGLILHLDGIDYGGDPTKWIDLINGKEFIINGDVSRGINCFTFVNGSADYSERIPITHIEVVLKRTSVSGYGVLLNSDAYHIIAFNGSTMQFNSGYDDSASHARAIPTTLDELFSVSTDYNLSGLIYKNGQIAIQSGSKEQWPRGYSGTRIGLYMSGGYAFKGDICSVRGYNRSLTAEEIAQNFSVDKERFGIEV